MPFEVTLPVVRKTITTMFQKLPKCAIISHIERGITLFYGGHMLASDLILAMSIHIGREIEAKFKESGMKLSEFAKRIHTSRRNIYDIFERSEIKTDQLIQISSVLHFNFFELYQGPKPAVEDPAVAYPAKKTIAILVELDGQETSLKTTINRLTVINNSLK